jgi:signal transduction histidine kinase/CheY-like chemotaxis protein
MLADFTDRLKPGSTEFHREFRIVHPTRGVRWIHTSGSIDRDAKGRAIEMRGISIDISRIKQVEEELREADQRKNEFLATLAHELRNPLAPIRNGLEILRLTQSGDVAERARSMMDRQLQQMVHLIDDLLEVSRITRGKIQLNREPIDLETALQSAIEVSKPLINAAGHKLNVDVPPGQLIVDGDLTRLAQVFGNLLNNAAKYTNRNGRIWLSAAVAAGQVRVTVRDDGIGITPAMLPRIFEMFTQVDHSARHTQGGLGIGLCIAKRLVEMHGGVLTASSDGPGTGSEFTVRLPLHAASVTDLHAANPDDSPSVPHHVLRVLVADDNVDAAASLSMILKMNGHDVRTAYDGQEASRIIESFDPDVALLDIGMPHVDGYELCRRLRAQPYGRDMFIVALTGWGQAEDKQRSEEAGFDQHLVKPADIRTLEHLLAEAEKRVPKRRASASAHRRG